MSRFLEAGEHILRVPNLEMQLDLLRNYGKDIRWGEKGKGHVSFVAELSVGESRLLYLKSSEARQLGYKEGVLGESDISCVYVYYQPPIGKRLQLKEYLQIFVNGYKQSRGFGWVSEKSLYGETPIDTAIRAIKEELNLEGETNEISPKRLHLRRQIVKDDTAHTYPGLQTRIFATDFEIYLTAKEYNEHQIRLPDGRLVPGFIERQEDKQTLFTWGEAA